MSLVISHKIQEFYKKLFRLTFGLLRARYLLHRKRFFDNKFEPSRTELLALYLMMRFVNVYHNFVFINVIGAAHQKFLQKFLEVLNILKFFTKFCTKMVIHNYFFLF